MKKDDYEGKRIGRTIVITIFAVVCAAAVCVGAVVLLFQVIGKDAVVKDAEIEGSTGEENDGVIQNTGNPVTEEEANDPQSAGNLASEEGAETEITKQLISGNAAETDEITMGIDVSRYQGTIDWKKVAETGIDFVMVRVGYRTQADGKIMEDSNARYNMQEAAASGLKVGAYFFSTAVTEEEAKEEAKWVADYILGYQITYPVAYDCEGFLNPENRQYNLTKSQRTDYAIAFLNEIYNQGYTPMFYASKNQLAEESQWETGRIEKNFKIWVSQYPAVPYPETKASGYTGLHDMWQYTNNGTIAGINEPVDVNVAYFGYENSADAMGDNEPKEAEPDVEALMNFKEVNETVTAKDVTNLRDIPGQGADSTVLRKLKNGETAARTGISDSGWSRLEMEGKRYYAVSNYLTTDLSPKPEEPEEEDDGVKTVFTDCQEQVTPKIEVNLRTIPSVTNPDAVVVATVKNGEVFTRTGINTALGWSRVEYNGQVLYCVSSYVSLVE